MWMASTLLTLFVLEDQSHQQLLELGARPCRRILFRPVPVVDVLGVGSLLTDPKNKTNRLQSQQRQ